MNRKQFLQLSLLGMGGVFLSNTAMANIFPIKIMNNREAYPVLMIGSGYGNAVAALRLAEKGIPVIMLEAGLDWEKYKRENPDFVFPKMNKPTKESTWLRNTSVAPIEMGNMGVHFKEFTGILERQDFEHIKVYLGKGVGGGSLVNGGMTVTPDRTYLKNIFHKVGVELPTSSLYETYFPLVNKELGMAHIPEDLLNTDWYKFSRMGVEEGISAGFEPVNVPNLYDFDHLRKEIQTKKERSATSTEVIYGNNYGKRDLTKTYLKKALSTGNLTILPLHRADTIQQMEDGTYIVHASETNTQNQTIQKKVFKTKHLFLGAGSMGTTEILLRSKHHNLLPNLDENVGKFWANNGNTMASRYTWMVLGHTSRGNKQSTMPVRGLTNMADPQHTFFAEIAPMPIMGSHTAMYLIVNALKNFGELKFDAIQNKIIPQWDTSHNHYMRTNAEFFLDRMNQYGSKGILGNTYINNKVLFPNNGIDESICYHPLGGCVWGKATDKYGQLNGYKNLFVTDGSLVPGSLGVNPYVTITALSEMCTSNILRDRIIES